MTDLWGPIVIAEWRSTPAIRGRSATEADIKAGVAVFCIPSGSKPHPISLPICGVHRDEQSGSVTAVIVIQAEVGDDGEVFIGARPIAGGNMVCTLREVELVAEPDERF